MPISAKTVEDEFVGIVESVHSMASIPDIEAFLRFFHRPSAQPSHGTVTSHFVSKIVVKFKAVMYDSLWELRQESKKGLMLGTRGLMMLPLELKGRINSFNDLRSAVIFGRCCSDFHKCVALLNTFSLVSQSIANKTSPFARLIHFTQQLGV